MKFDVQSVYVSRFKGHINLKGYECISIDYLFSTPKSLLYAELTEYDNNDLEEYSEDERPNLD